VHDAQEPLGFVQLAVTPAHLTTANDGSHVELRGSNPFGTADRAWLETGVSLLNEADGSTVPFTTALTDTEQGGFSYDMTPTTPLTDGWYTLLVSPPADGRFVGSTYEGPATAVQRDDGKYETYFRVGSGPLLVAVAACASQDLNAFPKLILSFSEEVVLPSVLPVHLSVGFDSPKCVVNQTTETGAYLSCSPIPTAEDALVVAVSEGIVAKAGGSALRDAVGSTRMDIGLPPATPSLPCRTWRDARKPGSIH
jgi:hypothetical protein